MFQGQPHQPYLPDPYYQSGYQAPHNHHEHIGELQHPPAPPGPGYEGLGPPGLPGGHPHAMNGPPHGYMPYPGMPHGHHAMANGPPGYMGPNPYPSNPSMNPPHGYPPQPYAYPPYHEHHNHPPRPAYDQIPTAPAMHMGAYSAPPHATGPSQPPASAPFPDAEPRAWDDRQQKAPEAAPEQPEDTAAASQPLPSKSPGTVRHLKQRPHIPQARSALHVDMRPQHPDLQPAAKAAKLEPLSPSEAAAAGALNALAVLAAAAAAGSTAAAAGPSPAAQRQQQQPPQQQQRAPQRPSRSSNSSAAHHDKSADSRTVSNQEQEEAEHLMQDSAQGRALALMPAMGLPHMLGHGSAGGVGGGEDLKAAKTREKNRNAQRRFREKQRHNYQELLKHCANLEANNKQLQGENAALRLQVEQMSALRKENADLREELLTIVGLKSAASKAGNPERLQRLVVNSLTRSEEGRGEVGASGQVMSSSAAEPAAGGDGGSMEEDKAAAAAPAAANGSASTAAAAAASKQPGTLAQGRHNFAAPPPAAPQPPDSRAVITQAPATSRPPAAAPAAAPVQLAPPGMLRQLPMPGHPTANGQAHSMPMPMPFFPPLPLPGQPGFPAQLQQLQQLQQLAFRPPPAPLADLAAFQRLTQQMSSMPPHLLHDACLKLASQQLPGMSEMLKAGSRLAAAAAQAQQQKGAQEQAGGKQQQRQQQQQQQHSQRQQIREGPGQAQLEQQGQQRLQQEKPLRTMAEAQQQQQMEEEEEQKQQQVERSSTPASMQVNDSNTQAHQQQQEQQEQQQAAALASEAEPSHLAAPL